MATNTRKPNNTAAKAKARSAKVPQDRQTASDDVESTIVDYNYHGTVYQIDTDDFDDVEFIDQLQNSLNRGLRTLLGAEQHKVLIQQFKDEDPSGKGKARVTTMQEFFEDLQEHMSPLGG
ncbi:hypothetical protein ACIGDM_10315 [Rothia koreensis]|uniref:hypothetical protein n=1 Tax=Rothia koreensis TaxID=592378 RepID=UPI0037C628AE